MQRWIAGLLLLLALPSLADAAPSVQEILLRAKPAVALVVSEVAAEVTATCPTGGKQQVSPAPFRETGTGWFVNPNGWLVTNGHVVSPAYQPKPEISRELLERGVRQACGDLSEQAFTTAMGRATIKLDPSISVLLSNGMRLDA